MGKIFCCRTLPDVLLRHFSFKKPDCGTLTSVSFLTAAYFSSAKVMLLQLHQPSPVFSKVAIITKLKNDFETCSEIRWPFYSPYLQTTTQLCSVEFWKAEAWKVRVFSDLNIFSGCNMQAPAALLVPSSTLAPNSSILIQRTKKTIPQAKFCYCPGLSSTSHASSSVLDSRSQPAIQLGLQPSSLHHVGTNANSFSCTSISAEHTSSDENNVDKFNCSVRSYKEIACLKSNIVKNRFPNLDYSELLRTRSNCPNNQSNCASQQREKHMQEAQPQQRPKKSWYNLW